MSAVDAVVTSGGNDAFRFIGSGAFTRSADELRASTNAGGQQVVEGDFNGDGFADITILVTTIDATPLSATDFVL